MLIESKLGWIAGDIAVDIKAKTRRVFEKKIRELNVYEAGNYMVFNTRFWLCLFRESHFLQIYRNRPKHTKLTKMLSV